MWEKVATTSQETHNQIIDCRNWLLDVGQIVEEVAYLGRFEKLEWDLESLEIVHMMLNAMNSDVETIVIESLLLIFNMLFLNLKKTKP